LLHINPKEETKLPQSPCLFKVCLLETNIDELAVKVKYGHCNIGYLQVVAYFGNHPSAVDQVVMIVEEDAATNTTFSMEAKRL
jgi:hypothetical protein